MNLTRGERFKDARTVYNQHGKQSMRTVETCTGVSASVITYLESDSDGRNVGYPTIVALSKHYGVTTDFLLGLSPNPTTNKDLDAVCRYTGLTEHSVLTLRSFMDVDDNYLSWFNKYGSPYCDYALDRVNEFIDFAFESGEMQISFDDYRLFREAREEYNDSVIEWEKSVSKRKGVPSCSWKEIDAFKAATKVGFYPLCSDQASSYFRDRFCEEFKKYLSLKYPLRVTADARSEERK